MLLRWAHATSTKPSNKPDWRSLTLTSRPQSLYQLRSLIALIHHPPVLPATRLMTPPLLLVRACSMRLMAQIEHLRLVWKMLLMHLMFLVLMMTGTTRPTRPSVPVHQPRQPTRPSRFSEGARP